MPRTIETLAYQFDELSDKAKEKARDWWKNLEMQDCDLSATIDEFKTICELMGITIKTRMQPYHIIGGKSGERQEDNIFYSGFSSQGDGASFEGRYAYKPGFFDAVCEYAPQDGRLKSIAAQLLALQKSCGYRLSAVITVDNGHYVHSGYMRAEVLNANEDNAANSKPLPDTAEKEFTDIMRAFADWLYRQLESEYFSHFENEYVDESIRANEYEFTAEGKKI